MSGLREKQKNRRRDAILSAASTLFGQNGYESVRIDAIAEMAEVSVGTFYNYFENKADLLLAIVSMEVEEVLHQGELLLEAPALDPASALTALIGGYYDHSLVYLSKEMWRRAMALAIQWPETPFSMRYRALDQALSDQVVGLLSRLQQAGQIAPGLRVEPLGQMIFNDLNAQFTAFAIDEPMPLAALRAGLAARISALTALFAGAG